MAITVSNDIRSTPCLYSNQSTNFARKTKLAIFTFMPDIYSNKRVYQIHMSDIVSLWKPGTASQKVKSANKF